MSRRLKVVLILGLPLIGLAVLEMMDAHAFWPQATIVLVLSTIAGIGLGAGLNPFLNSAASPSPTKRGHQAPTVGFGVVVGLIVASLVPHGGALGALLAASGGFIAALAYLSPKLRDEPWLPPTSSHGR